MKVNHSSCNKWLPKSTHFSYQGIIARNQLVAIDFNLCSKLSQAESKSRGKRFNVTYSKATNNWSAKSIKEKKNRSVFEKLVSHVYEVAANGDHLAKPMLAILSKTTASVEKSCKSPVIVNQRSHFRSLSRLYTFIV